MRRKRKQVCQAFGHAFTPIIHGADLDVTIRLAGSGISGIELFDHLFAFVALLDWKRLPKGRALIAYLAGIAAMFVANGLRIASFVILGQASRKSEMKVCQALFRF